VTTAILHHAGDGSTPPVRVPHTIALAQRHPEALVVCGVDWRHADAVQLLRAVGGSRLLALSDPATDTLTEVTRTRRLVQALDTETLLVSTEPGHVGRAVAIARIVYWGTGVRIIASPSAPGTYRSPWRRTLIDVVRALLFRLSGRVVMW
jgi:uncharacterized SAM-binding protein YcdF (DUF218 family)